MMRPSPSVMRRRIPAAVHHALGLDEAARCRVEERGAVVAGERVVGRAADHEGSSIGQDGGAAAEDVVVEVLNGDAALRGARRIPNRRAVALGTLRVVVRIVLRSGDDQYLPGAQKSRGDRVDRHLVGQGHPLAGDVRDVGDTRLGLRRRRNPGKHSGSHQKDDRPAPLGTDHKDPHTLPGFLFGRWGHHKPGETRGQGRASAGRGLLITKPAKSGSPHGTSRKPNRAQACGRGNCEMADFAGTGGIS